MRRILIACVVATGVAGCEHRTEPSATLVTPVPDKRSDVHIQAPGVKIDVEKKDR
jgi:hypothetical protein